MRGRLAPLLMLPLAGCAMFGGPPQIRDRYARLDPPLVLPAAP